MSGELAGLPLLVLAAGRGTRMGEPKGLIAVRDGTLATWQTRRFRAAGGADVLFVLGESAPDYLAAHPDLPHVVNQDVDLGPFRSLQLGLEAVLVDEPRAVFVLPVDVPAPDKEAWHALVDGLRDDIAVVRPKHGEKRGHPVLLSANFARTLLALEARADDARLDVQIRRLDPLLVRDVPVADPQVVLNLNDQKVAQQWLANLG